MNITAPALNASELIPLRDAGCAQVYFGCSDEIWLSDYGLGETMTRRQGRICNITDWSCAQALVAGARAINLPIYALINGFYGDEMLTRVLKTADRLYELDVDGFVIADATLLPVFARRYPRAMRKLSIMANAANAADVAFFYGLGAHGVVLPRHIPIVDIPALIAPVKGRVDVEMIAFFDGCTFVDGYCAFNHDTAYLRTTGTPKRSIFHPNLTYKGHGCARCNLPARKNACAACRIDALEAAGVTALKVAGRGRPLKEILTAIGVLNAVDPPAAYAANFGACEGQCYYA